MPPDVPAASQALTKCDYFRESVPPPAPILTTLRPALLPSLERERKNVGEWEKQACHRAAPGEEQALEKEGKTAPGNTAALTLEMPLSQAEG